MQYTCQYESPLGGITIAADDRGLTGLWFDGQKYFADTLSTRHCRQDHPVLEQAIRWLDVYFSGRNPGFVPPVHLEGSAFRQAVWEILQRIPYGRTITYGEIAREMACRQGVRTVSAQAVGGAVGHNPVSLIVPCHRVVGGGGNLTGYAGGLDKKIALLTLEGCDMKGFFVPKKATACLKEK